MAVVLYAMAANKKHAPAQYKLGRCLEEGFGVEKNKDEALEFFTKAAKQGSASAQKRLADFYARGDVSGVGRKEAEMLYRAAALGGNEEARAILGAAGAAVGGGGEGGVGVGGSGGGGGSGSGGGGGGGAPAAVGTAPAQASADRAAGRSRARS